MKAAAYAPIRKLAASDRVVAFDCGQPALNQYLQRFALSNQWAHSAQSYVATCAQDVAGYYCLAVGSVEPELAPPRVVKGLSRHAVPVMLLARLAVDHAHQGVGLGRALLKDALLRTARVADMVGVRAVLVHAKDEAARNWYRQWEFEPSVTNPLHLYLLMKDMKAMVPGAC